MAKNAWITGAAGFLGRNVCLALNRSGWKVYGLGRGNWSLDEQSKWGLQYFLRGDVNEENLSILSTQSPLPELIVHCAGGSSVGFASDQPGKDFEFTVLSLSVVLDFIRINSLTTRLIYPSSAAVYGSVLIDRLNEGLAPRPYSPYGVHKYLAEQLLMSYHQHYGLDVLVIRFFSIYGNELRKQLLWDACNKLKSGNYHFAGTGDEQRDFIHITDAANLITHLCGIDSLGDKRIINGGTGNRISVRQVIESISRIIAPQTRPVFSGAIRAGDPKNLVADTTLAESVGWLPSVTFDSGVREYAEWFQRYKGD